MIWVRMESFSTEYFRICGGSVRDFLIFYVAMLDAIHSFIIVFGGMVSMTCIAYYIATIEFVIAMMRVAVCARSMPYLLLCKTVESSNCMQILF